MKILLAPSETKKEGGIGSFNLNNLIFNDLNKSRLEVLESYNSLLKSEDLTVLSKLFGLKKEEDIKKYIKDITKEPTLKAIVRYTGVAFDFLDYNSLESEEKEYIDNNVLIFSNLFGILQAKDEIPLYKLKQGEPIGNLKVDKVYSKSIKVPLDNFLEDEDILDLRAKYYEKFYKPNKRYTTLKFLKNGKVVSHWAKAYRGMVLRELAVKKVNRVEEFLKIDFETLEIAEIIEKKSYNEIVYNILE